MLPITLTMAAAAALINVWLASRVVRLRWSARIAQGDDGNRPMLVRMRSHANFTEYTPFVLILIGLIEYSRGAQLWLWIVGIVYMLARLAHPIGMQRPAPNAFRAGAMMVTWSVLIGLAAYAIYLTYATPLPTHL